MLDLCSGFGGASEAMKRNGWDVLRVDIEPRVKPDIVADMRFLPFRPYPLDLLWISVPCTEYARLDMPWHRGKFGPPDLQLWREAHYLRAQWQPRYFCIENVRGAQKWWGQSTYVVGSHYLWTDLPFKPECSYVRDKDRIPGDHPLASALRGRLPYALSDAIRQVVEAVS